MDGVDSIGLACCCIKGIDVKTDGSLLGGLTIGDYAPGVANADSSQLGGYYQLPKGNKLGYVGVAVQVVGDVDGDASKCKPEQTATILQLMRNGQAILKTPSGINIGTQIDDIQFHHQDQNPNFMKVVQGHPTFVDPGPAYPRNANTRYEVKLTSSFSSGGWGDSKCKFKKCSMTWHVIVNINADLSASVAYWTEPMICE